MRRLSEMLQESADLSSAEKSMDDIKKEASSEMKEGASTTATSTAVVDKVTKAVEESADLIAALECVAGMYGIPAENIIADPNATSIRVQNDNIIAPPVEAKNQTKPIIQAVGSVLDYISQRIDDKLNDYQMNNINQGRIEDSIRMHANPMKGKCIGRYEDDEGGEILAYDTGAVDAPNTPAARMKIAELRSTNTIPSTFDPSIKKPGEEYFNDEDEVDDGVDLDASADEAAGDVMSKAEVNDIADTINEYAYHVNLCAKMGDTRHLGYDLMRKHGFDFVKPVDSIVMEAASDDDDEKESKGKKKVRTADIKHMKFDNKNILKAVDYFNAARENQENAKNMNLKEFIRDPNFEKGIDCLNKQFDCRINFRIIQTKPGIAEGAWTSQWNDIKKKMYISKSKGFQLNGHPVDIFIQNHYLESSSPNEIELFGQNMVSTICHEIFHNIATLIRQEKISANMSIAMTMSLAAAAKTPKEKRIIITNYVDSLDELTGNKIMNKIAKKKLIKQLTTIAAVENSSKAVRSVNDNPDEYVDKLIAAYKKALRHNKPSKVKYILPIVMAAGGIVGGIFASSALSASIIVGGVGCGLFTAYGLAMYDYAESDIKKRYGNAKLYEEYYCDLFAGMYKLPKFFFVGHSKSKYVVNEIDEERIKKLVELEREYSKSILSRYPTELERTHAAVTIAKKLLEQKDLEPQVKKYCEWIVKNFSKIHNTNINTIYNKTTFNPKEAEDLDKHLEDLIKDNNLTLTESFKIWINSNEEIF